MTAAEIEAAMAAQQGAVKLPEAPSTRMIIYQPERPGCKAGEPMEIWRVHLKGWLAIGASTDPDGWRRAPQEPTESTEKTALPDPQGLAGATDGPLEELRNLWKRRNPGQKHPAAAGIKWFKSHLSEE